MIVRARFKARREQAMEAAWHTANFWGAAHSKMGLQPLAHYLTEKKPKGGGNARVLEMFRRVAAKQAQGNQDGTG